MTDKEQRMFIGHFSECCHIGLKDSEIIRAQWKKYIVLSLLFLSQYYSFKNYNWYYYGNLPNQILKYQIEFIS